MSDITLTTQMRVDLISSMGGDDSVVKAMMVSTKGAESLEEKEHAGRINFLMSNRHGTPFEHNAMTFFVAAPIMVFREFHRHRIGFSYNEMSGRYKQLPSVFYVPGPQRPLIQQGKPGQYIFVPGTAEQLEEAVMWLGDSYKHAYRAYEHLLAMGIAKEIARSCLPVAIFSEMYVTCNARSLMSFLSLRTKEESATFPSFPMFEIEQVARKMEEFFAHLFPLTYECFNKNGRVAP